MSKHYIGNKISGKVGYDNKLFKPNKMIFPNTKALAYYNFYSQTIMLNSIEQKDVILLNNAANNYNKFEAEKNIYTLYYHEASHWLDHTSTYWGVRLLGEIYSMSENLLRIQKGLLKEKEFHDIKKFINKIELIHFPKYYSTVQQKSIKDNVWGMKETVGRLYDVHGQISEHPIFFINFNNTAGNIARQPFSLASILEMSAVAQEISFTELKLKSLLTPDEQLIEAKLYKKEIEKILLSPELTTYSVSAHYTANYFNLTDAFETYKICAVLGRFVLNFPNDFFDKLNVTDVAQVYREHYKKAFTYKDRGALFNFLVRVIASKAEKRVTYKDIVDLVSDYFQQSNISLTEMYDVVLHEIKTVYSSPTMKYYNGHIENISINNFEILGLFGSAEYHSFDVILPDCILGDDYILSPYGLTDPFLEIRHSKMCDIEMMMKEFSEACIV
ncbi:hypothetical protein [Seleniivibrio woodruffii]|uniref:hypothetical protein n=1 Tax=Seleniivibrio woodruffii TaxID=1078050 RepID=UPI0026F28909|nr:hypothetical protein [Seleniivibrio woodruffii]